MLSTRWSICRRAEDLVVGIRVWPLAAGRYNSERLNKELGYYVPISQRAGRKYHVECRTQMTSTDTFCSDLLASAISSRMMQFESAAEWLRSQRRAHKNLGSASRWSMRSSSKRQP